MRCSIFVAALLASLASASAIHRRQGYPSCALPCIEGPTAVTSTTCSSQDTTCLCEDQAFLTAGAECIEAACTNPTDLAQALQVSDEACLAAGVTVTESPPPLTITPTSTPASASTPASTTPTSTSSTPSPTKTGGAMSNMASSNALIGLVAVAAVAFAL